MRGVIASIRERLPHHIDATIPVEKGTSQYRITAASTLDDAYNGTTSTLFDITAGDYFASSSVRKRKHHSVDLPHGSGRDRKVTRFVWDPMDYFDPTEPALQEVPEDEDVLFMRVQRYLDAVGDYVNDGPINIIMPKSSLGVARPLLTLGGTAPNVSAVSGEKAPADAMHLHLPLHSAGFILTNLSDTNALLVSFALGHPMATIPPEGSFAFYDCNVAEVLVGCNGATAAFSMAISLQNGP